MTGSRFFIGELARQAGVNPKTIRYYEAIELLPPASRGENRYRLYPKETVGLLQFVAKAKALGFTLAEIREIVGISRQRGQPCVHVRALVEEKLGDLEQLLSDLIALRKRLRRLLMDWKERGRRHSFRGVVCPHIETQSLPSKSK
jgi:DNA-binding transcriptional MerR regulator